MTDAATIEPASHRTVRESYGTGIGVNAGARLTATVRVLESVSGYVALDLSLFRIWTRHRASVEGDPHFDVDEAFRFSGLSFCLSTGFTYWR